MLELSRSSLPLVIVIDLDGTIIGDITPQIITFELAKSFKTAGVKFVHDMTNLKLKLKSGIIRPYFDTFVKSLNQMGNIEFFVYTASEKTWAEFIVKHIESATGIKINRPIFARNFCINHEREYKKGLSYIRGSIAKALKKKYNVSFSSSDLLDNILIVDNNNVYPNGDNKHLILCPTYGYRVPENVVAHINSEMFKQNYTLIYSVLQKYMPMSGISDYNQFQREFYTYYLQLLTTNTKHNSRYVSDKFWLHLRDAILSHSITKFDEKSVKYIKTILHQRLGNVHTLTNPIASLQAQQTRKSQTNTNHAIYQRKNVKYSHRPDRPNKTSFF